MVSRTQEIKKLDSLYSKSKNQVVLVYGARGCLKEELIRDFIKGKKAFYYKGRKYSYIPYNTAVKTITKNKQNISLSYLKQQK